MSYKFTVNFSANGCTYRNIEHILTRFGLPDTIVEIGVYEGGTTFWLSDALTRLNHTYKIYAIDPHAGSEDLDTVNFNIIADNFAHNLATHNSKCVEHISEFSTQALVSLLSNDVSADFVYVDGDHRASQVLTDLVLSWELLKVGGVMLCDDATDWKFTDSTGTSAAQLSPRMAIEMFIQCNWHKLEIVHLPDSSQTAFRKLKK